MAIRTHNIIIGVKGTTQIDTKKDKATEKRYTTEPQERVNICLNCTKPASECKGQCFGGV